MEKFILESGKALARLRTVINDFIEDKIEGNVTNVILFILAFFVVFVTSFSLIFGIQTLIYGYVYFLIIFLILAIILIWLAIFYESDKHLETDRHNFKVQPIDKYRIRFEYINIDKDSKEQFFRLLKGRKVQEKINFTVGNKSGDSANHRILFVLFDELLVGGIQDFSGERKRDFFQLLMNSFLMNNEPLKENTLKTSFSAWKNDQEKINSRNQRKFIRQMLNKE
ncbi:hypothetical protein SAMN04488033_13910 [Salegentibacter agarivorans]|uniref:Uncharacterized protein n=1 Tax=Salegentibacter agarivorans TaxID=345907 RepID=A0A1I2Q2W8_9FLAO|nr:hypothetical protein [Salegentibacter agarivorans]SFG21709.1 hypothetical protein SAMN04488033_13910 [Salegentibacter agarivorans]